MDIRMSSGLPVPAGGLFQDPPPTHPPWISNSKGAGVHGGEGRGCSSAVAHMRATLSPPEAMLGLCSTPGLPHLLRRPPGQSWQPLPVGVLSVQSLPQGVSRLTGAGETAPEAWGCTSAGWNLQGPGPWMQRATGTPGIEVWILQSGLFWRNSKNVPASKILYSRHGKSRHFTLRTWATNKGLDAAKVIVCNLRVNIFIAAFQSAFHKVLLKRKCKMAADPSRLLLSRSPSLPLPHSLTAFLSGACSLPCGACSTFKMGALKC